jgi:hypothetical protein
MECITWGKGITVKYLLLPLLKHVAMQLIHWSHIHYTGMHLKIRPGISFPCSKGEHYYMQSRTTRIFNVIGLWIQYFVLCYGFLLKRRLRFRRSWKPSSDVQGFCGMGFGVRGSWLGFLGFQLRRALRSSCCHRPAPPQTYSIITMRIQRPRVSPRAELLVRVRRRQLLYCILCMMALLDTYTKRPIVTTDAGIFHCITNVQVTPV